MSKLLEVGIDRKEYGLFSIVIRMLYNMEALALILYRTIG